MNDFNLLPSNEVLYAKLPEFSEKVKSVLGQLNESDNDPEQFWNKFLEVISVWNLEFTQEEKKRQTSIPYNEEIEEFLLRFKQALEEKPIFITILNVQCVTNETVLEFLQKLQSMDISKCFVCLLHSRQTAKKETGSLRQRERAFGRRQLYYTEEEELAVYKKNNLRLNNEEFAVIRESTNGWMSMAGVVCYLIKKKGKRILLNFDHHLNYWLENEYLPQLCYEDQQFIYNLSVLDSFPVELIASISDGNIEEIYKITSSSPLYRYDEKTMHYSFAPFCAAKLRDHQELLDESFKEEFYVEVARWYQNHGDKARAAYYYQKTSAYDEIIQMLLDKEFPYPRGVAESYLEAIEAMPVSIQEEKPILRVLKASFLCTLFQYPKAYAILEKFCDEYEKQIKDLDEETIMVLGEAYTIRSYLDFRIYFNYDVAVKHYKRASELLPRGSVLFRTRMNLVPDEPVIELITKEAGVLQRSVEVYSEIAPYVDKIVDGLSGLAPLARAEMNFYTHNFKEVEVHAKKAVIQGMDSSNYDLVCSAYFLLLRFYVAKGDYKGAMENYRLIQKTSLQIKYGSFFSLPENAKSWFMLKLERPNEVTRWIRDESYYKKTFPPWNFGRDRVIRNFYLLETKQYDLAIAYAETNREWFGKRNRNILNLHFLMVLSVAHYKLKEDNKCVDYLKEFYDWSHANDVVMPIVEFGNYVRPVIETYRKSGDTHIPEDWLTKIEKMSNSYYVYCYNIRKEYNQDYGESKNPLEALSPNEYEILMMLSNGATRREIANAKEMTDPAIRSTIKRIYEKLNVQKKADVIRIAMTYRLNRQDEYGER